MKHARPALWFLLAALAAAPTLAADAVQSAAPAAAVAAHWQAVPLETSYSGFTTMYSCYGIEDKVRLLLHTLGARDGARVVASGCESGPDMHVSRFAWLRGEFHVLVPGAAENPAETVQASWQPVALRADHPLSVGEGDCELVEQLEPAIEKAGWLRDAKFETHCVPQAVNPNSFSVQARALAPIKP